MGPDSLLILDTYKMDEEMKYNILYQIVTFLVLFIYKMPQQLRDRHMIVK